jgi:hypothetical protein
MMRVHGETQKKCTSIVNKYASKKGQGGCTLKWRTHSATLCGSCKDKHGKCPHGVQNASAGIDGCNAPTDKTIHISKVGGIRHANRYVSKHGNVSMESTVMTDFPHKA